jgi:hypothetical protein
MNDHDHFDHSQDGSWLRELVCHRLATAKEEDLIPQERVEQIVDDWFASDKKSCGES